MAKATKKCSVCHGEPKYKCAKCRIPYCSVACYTKHRETCEVESPKTNLENAPLTSTSPDLQGNDEKSSLSKLNDHDSTIQKKEHLIYPDTISPASLDPDLLTLTHEKLDILANSPQLRQILQDPDIRTMIKNIDDTLRQEEQEKQAQLEKSQGEADRLRLQHLNWSNGTKSAQLMTSMRQNDASFAKLTETLLDLVDIQGKTEP